MDALETADRTQPTEVAAKTERLREKIDKLREQMRNLDRTAESLQSVKSLFKTSKRLVNVNYLVRPKRDK